MHIFLGKPPCLVVACRFFFNKNKKKHDGNGPPHANSWGSRRTQVPRFLACARRGLQGLIGDAISLDHPEVRRQHLPGLRTPATVHKAKGPKLAPKNRVLHGFRNSKSSRLESGGQGNGREMRKEFCPKTMLPLCLLATAMQMEDEALETFEAAAKETKNSLRELRCLLHIFRHQKGLTSKNR